MKKSRLLFAALFLLSAEAWALTPEEILSKVDYNEVFQSIKYTGVMIIKKGNRRQPREKTFTAAALGKNRAFVEFTNPGDRGTRYLKLGDELWVKGPYAERPDKISGHMLRDSMMGSDYSYEDTMDNEKLTDKYAPEPAGTEKVNGRDCYVLKLKAKVKQISYAEQMLWVDTERFVALKVRYYALSGMLLKEMIVEEVKLLKDRYFPVKVKMENKQRKDSYTLFEMKTIILDEPIDPSVFSKQRLEK